MPVVKEAWATSGAQQAPDYQLEVLSRNKSDIWTLNLPPELRVYQSEIETLLGRVFEGKQSQENFQLAQQMTINWCLSKYRKMGLSPNDTEWL